MTHIIEYDDSDEVTRKVEGMKQKNFVFGNSGSLQKIVTHLCCFPYFTAATLLQLFSSLFLFSFLARDLCRSFGWSDPTSYSGWVTSHEPDSQFGKQSVRCFQK